MSLRSNIRGLRKLVPADALQLYTSAIKSDLDIVNIKEFGGVCNGEADDSVAWQDALDFVAVNPHTSIQFTGRSKVAGPITSEASSFAIIGGGPRVSEFVMANGNTDIFSLSGSFISLSGFTVLNAPGVPFTNGSIFNFTGPGGNVFIRNVFTILGWNVLNFSNGAGGQVIISDCIFNDSFGSGVIFGPTFGGFALVNNLLVNSANASRTGATGSGILVQRMNTMFMSNSNVSGYPFGIQLNPPPGSEITDFDAVNVQVDGVISGQRIPVGFHAWFINGTQVDGGVGIGRVGLTNCWGGSMPVHGAMIQGAYDVELNNFQSYANGHHGVLLAGSPTPTHCRIIGGMFAHNSYGNANNYDGIHVNDFVSNFSIIGAMAKSTSAFPNSQRYGIFVEGANHDDYIVRLNQTRGNITGGVLDQGTGSNKSVGDNIV